MRALRTPEEIVNLLKSERKTTETIGLVPTMGALHAGHFGLIERSLSENEVTVVSIFVNPIQFDNQEDLANYPRSMEADLQQLESLGVDLVFIPEVEHLYPSKPQISIDFGGMGEVMEGAFRKGHFNGVGIVVSMLLNIVQPTSAYFGLKDLQQYLLIKRMCADLHVPTTIVGVETVREKSGLAMSSRNQRLSSAGLEVASSLYKGLRRFSEGLENNESLSELMTSTTAYYRSVEGLEIEYLDAFDARTLEQVDSFEKINELAICVAGYVEGIRLIDNLYLRLK